MASPVCYATESYFLAGGPPPTTTPSTSTSTSTSTSPPNPPPQPAGTITSLSLSATHTFSKPPVPSLTLIPNLGVSGDCHLGADIQHLSRRAIRPLPQNLRQVHLISSSFLAELRIRDEEERVVQPGELGENITTSGVDLEGLKCGCVLRFGYEPVAGEGDARVCITGLRNPCAQIERFGKGLLGQCTVREGGLVVRRRAGVMGVVLGGGGGGEGDGGLG